MSKYSGLHRVIRSHVNEEIENGGSGWGPFWFFFILFCIFIGGLIIISSFIK